MPEFWIDTSYDPVRRDAFLRIDVAFVEEKLGRRVTRQLSSLENRVFSIEPARILKIYRPNRWSREEIAEEHAFLEELHAAGIPVARALETGSIDGIEWAVFDRLEGTHLPDHPDDALLEELGRLLARMHDIGAARTLVHRPSLEPIAFVHGNLSIVRDLVPASMRDEYCERALRIASESAPLYHAMPTHRIHGDFYSENGMRTPRGIAPIDFDDMLTGPAVHDVWILSRVPPTARDFAEEERKRNVVLRGYREIRSFDDAWLALIPSLRALRSVWMNAWIGSRWFDPLFRTAFDRFETEAYWREQLARLT